MMKASTASPILLSEIVGMALESLWSNRLRTGLTTLGMVIGISSVVTVTAVGQGVQRATEQQIQSLGSNVLLVLAGASSQGGINQGGGSASTLTLDDAKAVAEQVTAARAVTAFLSRPNQQVVHGGQNVATTVQGIDLNFPDVKDTYPQQGQYFTQADLDQRSAVAVLGVKVRDALFGSQPAVGQDIRIQGRRFRVIGVMEPKGAVGNQDQDDRVYVPLTTMASQLVGRNALAGTAISGFWLSAVDNDQMDAAQFQLTNLLRLRHKIVPPQPDDFRIINQVDVANTFTSVVGLFTVMIGAIAGISLVVGGIGIANIMLVAVVERTREIGIRKALGATRGHILSQFLVEAVAVSLVGGGIGIIVGLGLSVGAAAALRIPLVLSPWSAAAGFGLSASVGLLAGVIPAQRAARLDPIAALRSD